jgi:hypothetical protein
MFIRLYSYEEEWKMNLAIPHSLLWGYRLKGRVWETVVSHQDEIFLLIPRSLLRGGFINLGFIARECMSREELEEKIDSGITREELYQEIHRRIQMAG